MITKNPKIYPKNYKGDKGLSAYQVALSEGFVGSEEAWLESLHPNFAGFHKITVGTIEPVAPSEGDIWFYTNI